MLIIRLTLMPDAALDEALNKVVTAELAEPVEAVGLLRSYCAAKRSKKFSTLVGF